MRDRRKLNAILLSAFTVFCSCGMNNSSKENKIDKEMKVKENELKNQMNNKGKL